MPIRAIVLATAVVGILLVTDVVAGSPATPVSEGYTVYLDGPRSLAQLRATHPRHFAAAQRIMAAAAQICRPGPSTLIPAWTNVRELTCAQSFFKSSNPPKRIIRFKLDQIQYVALVAVTDDPPRLVAAQGWR